MVEMLLALLISCSFVSIFCSSMQGLFKAICPFSRLGKIENIIPTASFREIPTFSMGPYKRQFNTACGKQASR